jgi:hypothetical protein
MIEMFGVICLAGDVVAAILCPWLAVLVMRDLGVGQ